MAKLPREIPKSNPAFEGNVSGVASNRSSQTPSLPDRMTDHYQFDDIIQAVAPPIDPNISGDTQTEDTYTWLAGTMTGWRENDDYRRYFERSEAMEPLICDYDCNDGDYDDNGGIPTAIGQPYGLHTPYASETDDPKTAEPGFNVQSAMRRI